MALLRPRVLAAAADDALSALPASLKSAWPSNPAIPLDILCRHSIRPHLAPSTACAATTLGHASPAQRATASRTAAPSAAGRQVALQGWGRAQGIGQDLQFHLNAQTAPAVVRAGSPTAFPLPAACAVHEQGVHRLQCQLQKVLALRLWPLVLSGQARRVQTGESWLGRVHPCSSHALPCTKQCRQQACHQLRQRSLLPPAPCQRPSLSSHTM